MTKRTAVYARVSTDEQAKHGYSRETQIEACRKYAADNGLTVVAELREDYSGAKLSRPELDKLRAMGERREIDAVIVYTADRLSRNLAHSLILREEWQKAGIELHYCNRGKSEDTAESRMTENIEAVFGDYWREKIMEGSRRGKVAKAKNGKWVGTGHPPYGYYKVGKGRETYLQIHPEESAVVKMIFGMYTSTSTQHPQLGIAKELTEHGIPPPNRVYGGEPGRGWHISTIHAILTRRAYIGEFMCHGQVVELPELALIDHEVFLRAQWRIQENKKLDNRSKGRLYLLTGRFTCTCGLAMGGYFEGGGKVRHRYYHCHTSRRYLTDCRERRARTDKVDQLVWNWLSNLLRDETQIALGMERMAARHEGELEPKRKQLELVNSVIAKAEAKIKRLMNAFGDETDKTVLSELKANVKSATKEKSDLIVERDNLIAELNQGNLTAEDRAAVLFTAAQIRQELIDPDFETKRFILSRLNVRVKLRRDENNLLWLDVTCGIANEKIGLDSTSVPHEG
jgi:site-specific DNA recombinase